MARDVIHHQTLSVEWTGNNGGGTSGYRDYERSHSIRAEGKLDILGSSDPAFRGDPSRWNPEELIVASISACHKLWYLHFCAVSGVVVSEYVDHCSGSMIIPEGGVGRMQEATLRPSVTIIKGDQQKALDLHKDAHEQCFIANSVNFPIKIEPVIIAP
jgi:organic hydroperoxide reductase OsmC/OhrA